MLLCVRALVEAGFLISPKSVLDPVQLVSFLGKASCLPYPSSTSAVGGLDAASPWGRQWAAPVQLPGPAKLACVPAWSWVPGRGAGSGGVKRWTGSGNRVRACVSNSSTVLLLSWHWRLMPWPHLSAYSFGFEPCLKPSSVWAGDLLPMWMGLGTRGAGGLELLFPSLESDPSPPPPPRKYASQHTTELHAVAWAVCLAGRLGMSSVTVLCGYCQTSNPATQCPELAPIMQGRRPGPRCGLGRFGSIGYATWMLVRYVVFCVCATVDLGLGGGGRGWLLWIAAGVLPCWSTVARLGYPSPMLCPAAGVVAATGAPRRRPPAATRRPANIKAGSWQVAWWLVRHLWLGAQAWLIFQRPCARLMHSLPPPLTWQAACTAKPRKTTPVKASRRQV